MKTWHPPVLLAAMTVALSACSSTATKAPVPTPNRVVSTPIPASLTGFASLADPTLRAAIGEGGSLLSKMRHPSDWEMLGSTCTTIGGDLANYSTTFHETYVPSDAKRVYSTGDHAFKLLMAGTDECGMAADGHDKRGLKQAASDFGSALGTLSHVEKQVGPWDAAGSSSS